MPGPFDFELTQERLPAMVPDDLMVERHDPETEAIIAAELNRCVLGETDRLELNMTLAARMARLADAFDHFKMTLVDQLRPAMVKAAAALTKMAEAFERKTNG
jgi:hypothetical protein